MVMVAMSLAVLPGCMMLDGRGMHGDTSTSMDRVPVTATNDAQMPDGHAMRDGAPSDSAQETRIPERAGAAERDVRTEYSTGMVILGTVAMVLMMALMM